MSYSTKWNKIVEVLAVLFLIGAFGFFIKPLLFLDFWYDEVMSLEEFIMVPLTKTVTHYPAPNNHIFFNLLMNLWCKLWGITTFAQAIESVWLVRLLPALFSVGTIGYVNAAGRQYFGKEAGYFSVVVLVSTVVFYNFSAQVRGYSLSMLLCSMLAYYSLSYYKTPKAAKGWVIGIISALFLYTVPSNLYAILSVLGVLVAVALLQWKRPGLKTALQLPAAKLGYIFLAGIVLGIVLYIPVIGQVVGNDYVKSAGMFRWEIWREGLQYFAYLSKPLYIKPLLLLIVCFAAIVHKNWRSPFWALLVIMVIPFVISFVRGDAPYDRVFLWIVPVFSLAVGAGFKNWESPFSNKRRWYNLVPLLFAAWFLMDVFYRGVSTTEKKLKTNLQNEIKQQDIYYNYYLAHYHPKDNLTLLKQQLGNDSTPVFLHEVDKYAMHGYLPALGLQWEPFPEKIKGVNKYYIITAFPKKAQAYYSSFDSSFRFTLLNPQLDFVNIIEAQRAE